MNRIALVTTCKNRLDHLQQTLPLWIAQKPDEIVVVDYGCPQGTGDWIASAFPDVKLVRVDDDPGFSATRARNFGAAAVQSDWICFIDADVLVAEGWMTWMRENVHAGSFYGAADIEEEGRFDLMGTVVVSRPDFERVGGYDEVIRSWGGDDVDLYERLLFAGCQRATFPGKFVSAISHGDERRATFSEAKSKRIRLLEIRCYLASKDLWRKLSGDVGDLPLETRRMIHARLSEAFGRWATQPEGVLPEFSVEGFADDAVVSSSGVEMRFRYTLGLRRRARERGVGCWFFRTLRRLQAGLGFDDQAPVASEGLFDLGDLLENARERATSMQPGDQCELHGKGFADLTPQSYRLHAECSLYLKRANPSG